MAKLTRIAQPIDRLFSQANRFLRRLICLLSNQIPSQLHDLNSRGVSSLLTILWRWLAASGMRSLCHFRNRLSFVVIAGGFFEPGLVQAESLSCRLVFLYGTRAPSGFEEAPNSLNSNERAWLGRHRVGRLSKFRGRIEALHVVSQRPLERNRLEALRLQAQVVVERAAQKLAEFGFVPQHPLYLLVEAHPQTVLLRTDELRGGGWSKRPSVFPGLASETAPLGVPDGKGVMVGIEQLRSTGDNKGKFLLLSALTEQHHTLDYGFMVAHELAHTTEKHPLGRIWREARADLLAYLATGQTDIRIPLELAKRELLSDWFGERVGERGGVRADAVLLRSLKEPTMHRFSGLVHGLYAAHFNSQVVSSALYAMARRFGDSKVAQFIHWMDGAVDSGSMLEVVSGESVAPVWRSFPRSQLDVVAASPGYWYRRRQAGQVVVDEVQELGQMIQNWAAEQGLEMVVMEKILRRRGLYKDETPAHQFEAAHFRYAN